MGIDARYPDAHADFITRCHKAGQTRPTPLLLQYAAGDYNALHQDLYGEHVFPLQLTILLSEPEQDFTGGEFVLTEQRPRMQSRAEVVPLRRGGAAGVAGHPRPLPATRGASLVHPPPGGSRLPARRPPPPGGVFFDPPRTSSTDTSLEPACRSTRTRTSGTSRRRSCRSRSDCRPSSCSAGYIERIRHGASRWLTATWWSGEVPPDFGITASCRSTRDIIP